MSSPIRLECQVSILRQERLLHPRHRLAKVQIHVRLLLAFAATIQIAL